MPKKVNPIAELKKTPWFQATVERYTLHRQTCKSLGVPPDTFQSFAQDIIGAPEGQREELLAIDACAPYEPIRSYEIYTMPAISEMFFNPSPAKNTSGQKKRRKKRKR